ncbi:hypothetical protein HMN09_00464500 [Mycena chlorophos]|uniref:Uncharacterized protein n=1 Tax=Mycena chlorophos TaxID=658473 RepID=A0A8H6TKC5_MYCCL|nr:hypothetical protein HMN09_00464500 [Mycena chlorophos]
MQADIVDPGGRRRMIPKRATSTETGFLTIVLTTTQVAPTTFVETIQETDVLTATFSDGASPVETTFLTFVTRTQTALETHTSVGLSVVPFTETLNDVAAGETTASSQTASASASSTTSSTATGPPTSAGAGAGTIAGAVLATLVVLAACVGAAVFLCNRRRRRRRRGDGGWARRYSIDPDLDPKPYPLTRTVTLGSGPGSQAAATGSWSEALASWSKPTPLVVMNPGGETSSLIMPVSGGGGGTAMKEKSRAPRPAQEDSNADALRNEIYALRSEVLTLRLEARAAQNQSRDRDRDSGSSGAETVPPPQYAPV